MKKSGIIKTAIMILLAVTMLLLTACGKPAPQPKPTAKPASTSSSSKAIPDNSILLFNDDEGSAKLMQFFKDGNVPTEATFLYDQMGSNPVITITDSEEINELYRLLCKVGVVGETNMSVTDCYHFVQFKLADDLYAHYSFEGDIWCYEKQNYQLENTTALFRYMLELTDTYREDFE